MLDVGCGVGLMTVLLAQLGKVKHAIGIDTSHRAIYTARAAVIPHDCDVRFQYLSKDAPWPDEEFDTIVCIDVLHHVPLEKQRGFVARLMQVGQRSRVIFKDVSPRPFWKALANIAHDLLISQQWIYIQDEEEVKEWFQDAGFSIIVHRRLDMLWYSHYLLVAEKKRSGRNI